ncbi:glycosylated lysosomal membrane protein [Syngnathoides biaculeatus]|uniref:glycosylated lysosomal membrane protein n=1 Tax=Syngnathoides biaculeatus TaxID=300417 RepID=UPI002ADE3550|nr:glycosylated lysosomal membrane protein [Syngnathoides biaculeatus]XP_061680748.1 glycosylated lysosomal membrane protein [Syngnathoides biaculeatus]
MAARRTPCAAFLFLQISTTLWMSSAFTRNLSVELNPGSSAPPPGGDLVHVRAVGDNDTLHILFCSLGAPTLLLVRTAVTSSAVSVDWPRFLSRNTSGSLRVEPASSIVSSAALVFSRLLEYDDVNNTAEAPFDLFPPYQLQDVAWSRAELSGAAARLCGAVARGSVCLQMSVFAGEGRDQSWPRLLHTANSSQVVVRLDSLTARSQRSRFLLELQTLGGTHPLDAVQVRRSIDDEFTPSIFKVSEWTSRPNRSSDDTGAFVLWKQVSYRRSPPALEDASPCRHSDPRRRSGRALAEVSGLVRAFFADEDQGERAFGLNVSFGLAGEPFYNATKFLSWTALVGVGLPPTDAFSPLVAAIVAVGLGAPLVILLMGGVYVYLRKMSPGSASGYEPIN